MKYNIIIITLICIFINISCSNNKIAPSVSNLKVTEKTPYTITVSAVILSEGSNAISQTGFCVNYPDNLKIPDYDNCDTVYLNNSINKRTFSNTITGLFPNSNYKICAFAINSAGIGYSETIIVTTQQ